MMSPEPMSAQGNVARLKGQDLQGRSRAAD